MSNKPNLVANITGEIKVGSNPQPPNEFTLSIENHGHEIKSEKRKPPALYLEGKLGTGEEALFRSKEDARSCTFKKPKKWKVSWKVLDEVNKIFTLKLTNYNPTFFEQGEALKIKFEEVISNTAPGNATVSFEFKDQTPKKLSIKKVTVKPDIISFSSTPPEGVQNLPGDYVTLEWLIHGLNNLELTRVGIADPLRCDFSKEQGAKEIRNVTENMTFCLKGYDGSRSIERKLEIKVLHAGWHDLKHTVCEGDRAYPSPQNDNDAKALKEATKDKKGFDLEPTLLFNANNQSIYAIFRHEYQGKERAFLFKTENPFGGWRFVNGDIPKDLSTSPGVYFNDKLWLIGGSQVDPDNTSNEVWIFDPIKNGGVWNNWKEVGWSPREVGWSPRMGHAVLVFQNKIWLMGGLDEDGNALNDVWFLDAANQSWTECDQAEWEPRCLFNPAVYGEKIWLYGGAEEPFAEKIYDDLYVYSSNGGWQRRDMTGIITDKENKKPIASALGVFQGKLHLIGKFRTINPSDKSEKIESLAYTLPNPDTKTWEVFHSEGLKDWGGDVPFSYQLINFKDKILIARALGYDSNPVLKVYVPGL